MGYQFTRKRGKADGQIGAFDHLQINRTVKGVSVYVSTEYDRIDLHNFIEFASTNA